MKTRPIILFVIACSCSFLTYSQVTVDIDLTASTHPVSPFLYGKNNNLSDDPARPLTAAAWQKLKDAGITIFRENGGNNSTKYNWRRKLSSHPDWYNNVYAHDWGFAAKSLQQNIPAAQGIWAFQLIGKAAKTTTANFNDWGYNQAQWWNGVNQNLAGGGTINPAGGPTAQQPGNPDLYLENWTADSTTGILDHWFGPGGIGLDKNKIQYWNMDNEVEIWSGTHDDIMPSQIAAENFIQQYFAVAKKARTKFPDIKLLGPVPANEWQWYNWSNGPVNNLPWLKYFIKRVAEEQQASGMRLLDVLDVHFYPSQTVVSNVVQYHRVYFDKNYVYPEANGVRNVNGSWDNSQNKEYILQRCREWLQQYMGANHGVEFGVTETGIENIGANGIAVWYAGTLGEFMRQPDMELFTPWSWYPAMWEVLHLYSRYNKDAYVNSVSSEEEFVSAYSTLNASGDSLTVVLVNRSTTTAKTVNLNLKGYNLANQNFDLLRLSNLPATETFVSHQTNALQKSSIQKNGNAISVSLPALSISSILLTGTRGEVVTDVMDHESGKPILEVFPNPQKSGSDIKLRVNKTGTSSIDLLDVNGKVQKNIYHGKIERVPFTKEVNISSFTKGVYFIRLKLNDKVILKKTIF